MGKILLSFFVLCSAVTAQIQVVNNEIMATARVKINANFAWLGANKISYQGAWSSGTTYNAQDLVIYSSAAYISLASSNVGNNPASAALWWVPLPGSSGSAATWGSITGTLSSQSDLNAALSLKAPVASPTFTGTVTFPLTGTLQCLHVSTLGVVSGTGSDCGSGGGGANASGYYWVAQSTNAPANAVNLGAFSTGLVKITVSGGVATPSIAVAGDIPSLASLYCPIAGCTFTGAINGTSAVFSGSVTGSQFVGGSTFSAAGAESATPSAPSSDTFFFSSTNHIPQFTKAGDSAVDATTVVPTACTGGQFASAVTSAGAVTCGTPSGSGNMSTSGTPAVHQVGIFGSSTTMAGLAPSSTSGQPLCSQGSSSDPAYCAVNLGGGSGIISGTLPEANLPTQLTKWSCQPGIGDGTNAISAGTYLQTTCYNDTGVTVTLSGIKCFSDNNGSSTMAVTNGAGTALLTGAVTCTNSFAAGTQSATVTIASGDYAKFTFVADGTSKQTTWVLTGSR